MHAKYLIYLVYFCMVALLSGCLQKAPVNVIVTEYNPDGIPEEVEPDIAFIYENDIYSVSKRGKELKNLTESPSKEKTKIALSFDKARIAYVTDDNIVEIIDTDGNFLERLDHIPNVINICWTPFNETLCILMNADPGGSNKEQIVLHGESFPLPDLEIIQDTPNERYRMSAIGFLKDSTLLTVYNGDVMYMGIISQGRIESRGYIEMAELLKIGISQTGTEAYFTIDDKFERDIKHFRFDVESRRLNNNDLRQINPREKRIGIVIPNPENEGSLAYSLAGDPYFNIVVDRSFGGNDLTIITRFENTKHLDLDWK